MFPGVACYSHAILEGRKGRLGRRPRTSTRPTRLRGRRDDSEKKRRAEVPLQVASNSRFATAKPGNPAARRYSEAQGPRERRKAAPGETSARWVRALPARRKKPRPERTTPRRPRRRCVRSSHDSQGGELEYPGEKRYGEEISGIEQAILPA